MTYSKADYMTFVAIINVMLRFRKINAKRECRNNSYLGSDSSWAMTWFRISNYVRDLRQRRGLQYKINISFPFDEIDDMNAKVITLIKLIVTFIIMGAFLYSLHKL